MTVNVGRGCDMTWEAGEDLSAKQYHMVELRTDGKVYLCDAVSAAERIPLGILQNNPEEGQAATVRVDGESYVVAAQSEALSSGKFFGCSAAGTATQIDATSTGADLGAWVFGFIVNGVTGTNPAAAKASVMIRPWGRVTA